MVVRLRLPQPLAELPPKISRQSENGQGRHLEPEGRAGEQSRDDPKPLHREIEHRGDGAVDGDKHDPDGHASRDGDDVILGPVVGDERGFSEDGEEDGAVHGGTPDPFAGGEAVSLDAVVDVEGGAAEVEDDGVVDGVEDPGGEDAGPEEAVGLAEPVQLRVAVE